MKVKYNIGQTLKRKVDAPQCLPSTITIIMTFEVESVYYSNPLVNCAQNNGNPVVTQSSHISYITNTQNQFEEQMLDNWYE